MESLLELENVIAETFNKDERMISFDEFVTCIEHKANIFLLLFCYIHMAIPILDKKLTIYRKKKDSLKQLSNLLISTSSDRLALFGESLANLSELVEINKFDNCFNESFFLR